MTEYQRIEQLLKYKEMSARALAIALGLKSPQIFYDIKAGKCGISKELATKIQDYFLNISAAWLLTGEGDMISRDTTIGTAKNVSGDNNSIGSPIHQTIGTMSGGQNAGRDIHNAAMCDNKEWLSELEAQRKLTEDAQAIAKTAQEQLTTALQQITQLINQNKEQFDKFMGLLQNFKTT